VGDKQEYKFIFNEKMKEIIDSFKLLTLAVSLRINRYNIQKFYTVLDWHWMLCTDLRTSSDLCFIHVRH